MYPDLSSVLHTRNDLPALLASAGLRTGAELGVAAGAFSERILVGAPEVDRLYSIDAWAGDRGHDVAQQREAAERLCLFGSRSLILRSRFEDALSEIPDESLDFLYVDGYAHTGQEGGKTLEDWLPKLRPGGLIGGHDYDAARWPKTVAAVDQFLAAHADALRGFHVTREEREPSWFAWKVGRVAPRNRPYPPFSLRDEPDENALRWGGKRGAQEPISGLHPMRGAPMFFRENGATVELLDLYRGAGLFLCLNGPSLRQVIADFSDLLTAPGVVTMGVNNGGHELRPNLWTCVDDPTRFMASIWQDPRIQKFVPMHHFEKRADGGRWVKDCPNVIGFRRNEKFLADQFLTETTVNWGNHARHGGGRSVMLVALRIAHLLGFRRVYLLGCDFVMDEERKYFFDEERTPQAIANNRNSYQILRGYFASLKPVFDAAGFEVFNANPTSGLDVFPKIDLEEAFARETEWLDLEKSTRGMYQP